MSGSIDFNYREFIKNHQDAEWKGEVINVFRCFDTECEGELPRDTAIHAISLLGINGEEYFHFTKKVITAQMFIDAVQSERNKNICDSQRRWKYIFHLIAGPNNDKISIESLQNFFTLFGHTPELKYCEDFIDEFDRVNITKTDISIDDWLLFCRVHHVPF
ncbi:hypothetical protein M9Y10_025537 [Tritrichomonas musculus]|uniref:EF-hand domain-containing protein n=1 Tax=Tritrichomonas musculus TaxID=1915356 RepID=A0ABR2H901_9EUKA